MLKGALNKVSTAIWNEIFQDFKSSFEDSERTLSQVKKKGNKI